MKAYFVAVSLACCTILPNSAMAQTKVSILSVGAGEATFQNYWQKIINEYEKSHPDVDVNIEFYAGEAYKTKLPTLLQSEARPDLIYSWAGSTLVDQAKAGFVADISGKLAAGARDKLSPAAFDAFTHDGAIYGLPLAARMVVMWTNRKLTEKAGVDIDKIKTWDDFLGAVKQIKAAGITPIIAGGRDKWPLHFYWSYLLLRQGGSEALQSAMDGKNGGFKGEDFVKAGELFQQLIDLKPFQPGVLGTTSESATGMFVDGEAAFNLMVDSAYMPMSKSLAQGNRAAGMDLTIMDFPMVKGGKGKPTDTLGGIDGFAVTTAAKPEAVDFLEFAIDAQHQREAGKLGLFIPVAQGAGDQIEIPVLKEINQKIEKSTYHQIFLDQYLGASVGGTVNDVSTDLVSGDVTPEEAAKRIQDAWDFR